MPKETNRPESGLWKDYINRDSVSLFLKTLKRFYQKLNVSIALDKIVDSNFNKLELKDRIKTVAEKTYEFLPSDFSSAIKILIKAAPHLDEFHNWILTEYVRIYGVKHFDDSIYALQELTKHGTAEFAIRLFVNSDTDKMMKVFYRWAKDENHHVRRLAAEGSRPRGVWVEHIDSFKKDPQPVIKLLEKLKADDSLYVRKAVANNLNDISKDHPETVIKIVSQWKKEKNKHTDWIIKHGCRSLIKKGYPAVFPIFGFTANPKIEIENFKLKKGEIVLNDSIEIAFLLKSNSSQKQKLAIDYKLHYMKKNGKLSPKVFKLSEKRLQPSESVSLVLKHKIKNNSTRKHYQGKHQIELMINGVTYGLIPLQLEI